MLVHFSAALNFLLCFRVFVVLLAGLLTALVPVVIVSA